MRKKAKNKKGKAVSLNLCFYFFCLKKALNINRIKTKTITLMALVKKISLLTLLVSEK